MATDITQEFCGNPETFMQNNVVLQWIQSGMVSQKYKRNSGLIKIGCKRIDGGNVSNNGGILCYLYLKDPDAKAPFLSAYWCNYAQNKFHSTMLGNDAFYAFTDGVTGCSVGLGSGSGGNQMLCHVNSAQVANDFTPNHSSASGDSGIFIPFATASARQAQSQDAQILHKLGQNSSIVSPRSYRHQYDTTQCTVFAVHGLGTPWNLFTHKYRKLGLNRYEHLGVSAGR